MALKKMKGQTASRPEQHLLMDKFWTIQSKCMTNVFNAATKRLLQENHSLQKQCHNKRAELQMALHGSDSEKIHNLLVNHKDLQRLFQTMPIHLVEQNLSQRVFVLRKEQDRLRHKLKGLGASLEEKKKEKAALEDQLKYQIKITLDKEIERKKIRNKIEVSKVRLNASKTLNDGYKKLTQQLLHDEIYYEPVLQSLQKDMNAQNDFINYIIELGLPVIPHLKKTTEQHRRLEVKIRRNTKAELKGLQNQKQHTLQRQVALRKLQAKGEGTINYFKRYVRETPSMVELKGQLEAIETTINRVKFANLCSKATEVFPRIKTQIKDNQKLCKVMDGYMTTYEGMKKKLQEHNLTKDALSRLELIRNLKSQISQEKVVEQNCIEYLKDKGETFVLLRYALWNFNDVLRHVLQSRRTLPREYPTLDLKLPLLKFIHLPLKAYPPERYEENINILLQNFKKRVTALMRIYRNGLPKEDARICEKEYHETFLSMLEMDGDFMAKKSDKQDKAETQEDNTHQNIPTRKQLKQISAKIIEEHSNKDD